ncbi:MAG: hypothetical protein CMK59_01375 [Proteobacteria bacterium]|nr:hypothetical protein [Pseudomonadota bacterium]
MPLSKAMALVGKTPALPKGPPYICKDLYEWAGISFWMEPTDQRLIDIHNGHPAPTPPLENLEGMIYYWQEHSEWMESTNPSSPVYQDKQIELELYLHQWQKYIHDNARVLDLGGGVGRFTQHLLKQNCSVELIDPDLRSLWRVLQLCSSLPGFIDLHWGTGETIHLLDLEPVDAVIACEVLNYVENPSLVLNNAINILKPNGFILLSVEARWGWAFSKDVAEGSVDAFLNDGIVHIPHDRWIRTYTKTKLECLLQNLKIIEIIPSHYSLSGPFEMATGPQNLVDALLLEDKLRNHPIAHKLNRAWMVVAQKPESS